MKYLPLLVSISALMLVSACSPAGMATGGAATAGVAATSEGGISGAATDFAIRAQINDLWFKYDVDTFTKLDLTVNQGRVLITGIVQDPEDRVEAVRLAWQPKGVKQVINEVRIAQSEGLVGYARDGWITTRLRTAITFDRSIYSLNYSIDTVQGTVYLMGVAQNQAEVNRVIETARTIPDVKQVVSYVKIRGEELNADGSTPPVSTGTAGTSMEPTSLTPDDMRSSTEGLPLNPAGYNNEDSYSQSGQPAGTAAVQPVQAVPLE